MQTSLTTKEPHPFSLKNFKRSKIEDPSSALDLILSTIEDTLPENTPTKFVNNLNMHLRSLSLQENKENLPQIFGDLQNEEPQFKSVKTSKRKSTIDTMEGIFESLESENTSGHKKSHKKVVTLPSKCQTPIQTKLSFRPSTIKKSASSTKDKSGGPIEENRLLLSETISH